MVVLFTFIFYTQSKVTRWKIVMKTWSEHRQEMIAEDRNEWIACIFYAAIIFGAAVMFIF